MRTINYKKSISLLNKAIAALPEDKLGRKGLCGDNNSLEAFKRILNMVMTSYYYTIREKNMNPDVFQSQVIVSCQQQLPTTFWIELELVLENMSNLNPSIQVHDTECLDVVFGKDTKEALIELNDIGCPFMFNFEL